MKKIFKIGLFPLFWLNKLVKQTNWYINSIPDKDKYPTNEWYRTHSERNFDIINLGSSSAVYAFDYSDTGAKAFNWALRPQYLQDGFKVLKNFFSILRHNGIILIPLGPFSGLQPKSGSNKANDRYFHILAPELIDNYSEVAKRRQYPLFALPIQSLKRLLKDVRKKNIKICKTTEEFESDAKEWIIGWLKEFSISDLDAPISEQNKVSMTERINTFVEIINFCKIRSLKPVIIMPPMHPTLASKFSTTFRNNYIYNVVYNFTEQGILFLDYIDDNRFLKDTYFHNSFFLNETGAKIFTKQVLEDLKVLNSNKYR